MLKKCDELKQTQNFKKYSLEFQNYKILENKKFSIILYKLTFAITVAENCFP